MIERAQLLRVLTCEAISIPMLSACILNDERITEVIDIRVVPAFALSFAIAPDRSGKLHLVEPDIRGDGPVLSSRSRLPTFQRRILPASLNFRRIHGVSQRLNEVLRDGRALLLDLYWPSPSARSPKNVVGSEATSPA